MSESRIDRRKKYTRMVLKNSLLILLQRKSITNLTVKEVCEVADVNRSTFYTHYRDLLALYEHIEDEIIDDLTTYLNAYHFNDEINNLNITKKLIAYFAEKQEVLKVLLNESGETSFQLKLMEVVHPHLLKRWMKFETLDNKTTSYIFTFVLTGSIEVIKAWLMKGMDQSPDEIAELINHLIINGINDFK